MGSLFKVIVAFALVVANVENIYVNKLDDGIMDGHTFGAKYESLVLMAATPHFTKLRTGSMNFYPPCHGIISFFIFSRVGSILQQNSSFMISKECFQKPLDANKSGLRFLRCVFLFTLRYFAVSFHSRSFLVHSLFFICI